MTRFLQHKKSVLDLISDIHYSFCTKCKTVLIRPLERSSHCLLTHFLSEQHLFTADPLLLSDLSMLVIKSLPFIFLQLSFKIFF